jgi:hypothetical protein
MPIATPKWRRQPLTPISSLFVTLDVIGILQVRRGCTTNRNTTKLVHKKRYLHVCAQPEEGDAPVMDIGFDWHILGQ